MRIWGSLLVGLFVVSKSWAQVPPKPMEDVTEGPGISGLAFNLITKVPGDFGLAIETYLETVRPQDYGGDKNVGQNNAGLVEHFQREISKDRCFLPIAEDLFADSLLNFKTEDVARIKSNLKSLNKAEYQPGWLWKKALSLANGNPNLAMKAIAYCGHDDVNRGQICPPDTSVMFMPEGLGPGVDTSMAVKDYVISSQAIHANAGQIRAKTYHIYGSAYLACRMVEKGVNPGKVPELSQKFAYIYRRIRTCRAAAENMYMFSESEVKYQKALRDFNRSRKDGRAPTFEDFVRAELTGKGQLAWIFEGRADHDKLAVRLAQTFYASKIYSQTTGCPQGKASELTEAISAAGAKLTTLDKDTLFLPANFDEECRRIAGSRCEEARKVLTTWDADFKWTMDQHKAGAEFAAKNCKPASEIAKMPKPETCRGLPAGSSPAPSSSPKPAHPKASGSAI